jgi:hypothetical protein
MSQRHNASPIGNLGRLLDEAIKLAVDAKLKPIIVPSPTQAAIVTPLPIQTAEEIIDLLTERDQDGDVVMVGAGNTVTVDACNNDPPEQDADGDVEMGNNWFPPHLDAGDDP